MAKRKTVAITAKIGEMHARKFDAVKLIMEKRLKAAEKATAKAATRAEEQDAVVEFVAARVVVSPSKTMNVLFDAEAKRLGSALKAVERSIDRERNTRFLAGDVAKHTEIAVPEGAPAALVEALVSLAREGLTGKAYKAAKRDLYAEYMPEAKSGAKGETATPTQKLPVSEAANVLLGLTSATA